jgi:hypothetical protein
MKTDTQNNYNEKYSYDNQEQNQNYIENQQYIGDENNQETSFPVNDNSYRDKDFSNAMEFEEKDDLNENEIYPEQEDADDDSENDSENTYDENDLEESDSDDSDDEIQEPETFTDDGLKID